jgi:hypothetical protein
MGTKENENQAGLGNSMRYYALLGISLDATTADVRKAFKKLALAHHPDKGGEEATFKAISCAYETLVDPIKRRKYDLNQAVRREGGSRGAPHPTASSPCIRSGNVRELQRLMILKTRPTCSKVCLESAQRRSTLSRIAQKLWRGVPYVAEQPAFVLPRSTERSVRLRELSSTGCTQRGWAVRVELQGRRPRHGRAQRCVCEHSDEFVPFHSKAHPHSAQPHYGRPTQHRWARQEGRIACGWGAVCQIPLVWVRRVFFSLAACRYGSIAWHRSTAQYVPGHCCSRWVLLRRCELMQT